MPEEGNKRVSDALYGSKLRTATAGVARDFLA